MSNNDLQKELKVWWTLAWPVSLAFSARVGMQITDLAMLGHLPYDPAFPTAKPVHFLGYAGLSLTWLAFTGAFINMGFGAALSTLCSQALGARNPRLCSVWLQCTLVVVLIACLPIGIAWYYTDVAIHFLVGEELCGPLCRELTRKFGQYSLLWLVPQALYSVLSSYFQAQQIVYPALTLNCIFVLVNGALSYTLVFGVGSFQGLGYVGSPIATAISRLFLVAIFLLYTCVWKR